MPQAVAAAVASWWSGATVGALAGATAAGTVTAVSVGLGTAFVYGAAYLAATVAIGAGLGALARAVASSSLGSGSLTEASAIQMSRSAVAPRRVIYGKTRVSGPLVFASVSGDSNEYLHMIVVLAGHECEEIGDVYFNDEAITLDGSGLGSGDYAGLVRVKKHLGTDDQQADADLIAECAGTWTSAHRLRGIAYLYVRLQYDTNVFPGGIPNVSAIVKGRKVYDPRTGSTAWSANVALCIRDYLTNASFGLAFADDEVDETTLVSSSNLCDESVTLASDETESRYTCNGVFDTSSDPVTVLTQLTGAMAGWVVFIGGKCILGGGAHQIPSLTLTESDLSGTISVQTKVSMRDTCNRVKGTYSSPDDLYQSVDFPEVTNATYLEEDGGVQIWRDLSLGFTTSAATAQRLAKIELERTRQDIVVTMPCKLTALACQPGDVIMVSNDRFGWDQKQFLVTELKFQVSSSGAPTLGVDLTLRETASAVWDWADGEETTTDPSPNTTLPDPSRVASPSLLTLLSEGMGTLQQDGTYVPRLRASWLSPADQSVLSGGRIQEQYKLHTESAWLDWSSIPGIQNVDYLTDVAVGRAYDVRIRGCNNLGATGAWVEVDNHTIADDTTVPAAPTSLTSLVQPGYVSLTWPPSASNAVNEYLVFRGMTGTGGSYALLASTQLTQYDDATVTPGITYYYKVYAQSRSEVTSIASAVAIATAALPAVGATTPAAPTAAAKPSPAVDGTYDAVGGGVFSYITISVPSLPTNAVWQNLLYRRTGAVEWLVAAQLKNTSTVSVRIDDLTPGVSYEFATQAWSPAGASIAVTATGSPFAAPSKTDTPPDYADGSLISAETAPILIHNEVRRYGLRLSWAESSGDSYDYPDDFAYWEVKAVATNSSSATDYIADDGTLVPGIYKTTASSFCFYSDTVVGAALFWRPVNTSGIVGNWAQFGGHLVAINQQPGGKAVELDVGTSTGTVAAGDDSRIVGATQKASNLSDLASASSARTNLGLGTVATQSSTALAVTGLQVGTGASVRKVIAVYAYNTVVYLAGGSASELITVDLTGRGFTAKPDSGECALIDPAGELRASYDYSNAGNSSLAARVKLETFDGATIGAGYRRVSFLFIESD